MELTFFMDLYDKSLLGTELDSTWYDGMTYISIVGRIPYLYFSSHIRHHQLEFKRIVL